MTWTIIHWYCKHRDKTLPQVLFSDPDWFFFQIEKRHFEDKGHIREEAKDLDWKARNIRIPGGEEGNLVAEYHIEEQTGTFRNMVIVARDSETEIGEIAVERKGYIDLSYPRHYRKPDKIGCRILLWQLKFYYFGNSSYPMTKERCEAFFENDDNFVIRRRS